MEDLRKNNKTDKNKFILKFIWKHKWKILLILSIIFIVFFPTLSGQILGQWFSDFVGNLFKYAKFW